MKKITSDKLNQSIKQVAWTNSKRAKTNQLLSKIYYQWQKQKHEDWSWWHADTNSTQDCK